MPIFNVGRGGIGSLSHITVTPDIVFDKLNSSKSPLDQINGLLLSIKD